MIAVALLGSLQTGSSSEDSLREVDLALVLAFGLNRSRDAAERLERLLDDIDDAQWGYIAGQIPLMWLLAGEIHRARHAAELVLADDRASEADRLSAELVLIPALNLVGQPVSALERAATVLPRLADHPAFNEYVVGQLETALPTGHRYVGDLDAAEEAAQLAYERVTLQGADLLRGVYALRLGQITLWHGGLGHAEQYFLEAVTALEGDAMTRASAVDHIRYTRALLGRSDMPSTLAPGTMYAVEHEFLSSAVEAAAGDLSYARSVALGAARRGPRPATSPTHFSPCTRRRGTGRRRGRRRARRAAGDRGAAAAHPRRRHRGTGRARRRPAGRGRGPLRRAGLHPARAELTTAAATVAAGRGQRTAAARLRTRAQQLVERCDGATTELLRRPELVMRQCPEGYARHVRGAGRRGGRGRRADLVSDAPGHRRRGRDRAGPVGAAHRRPHRGKPRRGARSGCGHWTPVETTGGVRRGRRGRFYAQRS